MITSIILRLSSSGGENMALKRKDSKGRILRDGETQREDGRYMYRYVDSSGNRKTEYSWRLVETDSHPAGKKRDISLREKEVQIQKDLLDGINTNNSTITLNELFERYIRTKKAAKTECERKLCTDVW